jgi:hypothetical protein
MDKLPSKSVRILTLIELLDGMRYTEIVRALCGMSGTRFTKGHWGTNLIHLGLLRSFCTKGSDGKWRRNSRPHHGHPWSHIDPSAVSSHAVVRQHRACKECASQQ